MPTVWIAPGPGHWFAFAASGAVGLGAHFAILRALSLADASAVAPLNYVRLLWAVAIGVVVFGDWPDAATLAGGALIVASGVYVLRGAR
jgi:drug/metabolite transporter (DMT)-like permease